MQKQKQTNKQKKITQPKIYGFLDNLIWIGNGKFLSIFYNIFYSAKCLWNTVVVSFLAKFIAGCFELGKKMKPGLFQKHYALCNGGWYVFHFQGVMYY